MSIFDQTNKMDNCVFKKCIGMYFADLWYQKFVYYDYTI